jgi:PAS domain S-box-containing protein
VASLVQLVASAARRSRQGVVQLWQSLTTDRSARREAMLLCLFAAMLAWAASETDLARQMSGFMANHPQYHADALLIGTLALGIGALIVAARRANEGKRMAILLRDALDSASEGFVIYDQDDRLVLVNETYRRLFPNRARSMVPGARFEDLMRQFALEGEFPAAIGREEEWYAAERRRHRETLSGIERQLADGRWILLSSRRMHNGGVVGLRVDITEQKRVQDALRQSESRLRDFAEMTSDWLWEQDDSLRFTFGSGVPKLQELVNGSFLGRLRWEIADPPADETEAAQWAAHRADLEARRPFQDFRYHRTHVDGRVRYLSANGRPIFNANGVFVGYRGTGNDITARVEAERELRKSRDASEAASRAKSEFLATMSHELRTPLHAIIGFSELIGDQTFGAINPKYLEYAKDIRDSGVHLLDLINEVLDLSTLDAGHYKLHEERVLLAAVIDSCVRMLDSVVQEKQALLIRDLRLDAVIIQADRRAMRQVFVNLLDNALKFIGPGGTVSITVRPVSDDMLRIAVEDTGIGIEPAQLRHVFEPFYQVDGTPSRRHGGAGLGLAICQKLLALHGGSIELESELGRGTIATAALPLDRVIRS